MVTDGQFRHGGVRELPTAHMLMLTMPAETAELLAELAA